MYVCACIPVVSMYVYKYMYIYTISTYVQFTEQHGSTTEKTTINACIENFENNDQRSTVGTAFRSCHTGVSPRFPKLKVLYFSNTLRVYTSLGKMATDICTRRLTRELRALQKDPLKAPKVTVQPNETNILEMHYVIEGSEKTPYEGGVYWGKLLFPKTYPLKPPGVVMMTPSGRFQPNRRLCLSMSDFHPGK